MRVYFVDIGIFFSQRFVNDITDSCDYWFQGLQVNEIKLICVFNLFVLRLFKIYVYMQVVELIYLLFFYRNVLI